MGKRIAVGLLTLFLSANLCQAGDLDGIWKRDDGPSYRFVQSGSKLLGYRTDGEAYGCRVFLQIKGRALEGKAQFTRVADEGGQFTSAWKLIHEGEALVGELEGVDLDDAGAVSGRTWEQHRFSRAKSLTDREAKSLRKALPAHLKADARLAAGDVLGASSALTLAKFAVPRDGTEWKHIQRRLDALAARKNQIEGALRDAKQRFAQAQALIHKGDAAGALEHLRACREAWPKDRIVPAIISLCEQVTAAKDRSPEGLVALAKSLRERVTVIRKASAVLPREAEPYAYSLAAALYGEAYAAEAAQIDHLFDQVVALFYADRLLDAGALINGLVKRAPETRSRKGHTALAWQEAIDEALTVKPTYEMLWEKKNQFARSRDPRQGRAEELFKEYRAKWRSATGILREHYEQGQP